MTAPKPNIKLMPPSISPWRPDENNTRRILALMSGGVDSSVTAYLLKQQGWDVVGITMKIPSCDAAAGKCCGAEAAFVCNDLSIPHYFVDVTEPFEQLIIEPFRQAYSRGWTPNPCVDCNSLLKFSLVWDFLDAEFGITHLATGHYARVVKTAGLAKLARAKDSSKDQSYFLYGITSNRLDNFVLPLGDLTKQQVRAIAAEAGLSVAEKAESMELCFAGEGDYRGALLPDQANRTGDITDMAGNRIGEHQGIANYTIGQRRGVGFAAGKPLYVGKINAANNTIALGAREQVSFPTIKADQINVLVPDEYAPGKQLTGKIRSYGDPRPCKIVDAGERDMIVEFDKPQFAPCPGQKLVLYDSEDNVVAGGTIVSSAAAGRLI